MTDARTKPFEQGDRIRLIEMPDDPDPIPPGTEGVVIAPPLWISEYWQVVVKWDIPRSLNLCVPPDRAELA